MMEQAIRAFHEQFSYEPVIMQPSGMTHRRFVVCGMGGSHLPADLIARFRPTVSITVHSDYGLPAGMELDADTLVIASSYSGNTEETISGFEAALERGIPVLAMATGGKLIARAKEAGVPYIEIPDTGIQPRSATGFMFRAMAKAMGDDALLAETNALATALMHESYETRGTALAADLTNYVPVIYSSKRNQSIAYNWKIKCNETGKIPAFYNVLPEANHNEMTGFDRAGGTRDLSEKFYFLFITDDDDHPQIQKRMAVMGELYKQRGNMVQQVPLAGGTEGERVFGSLLTADWMAYQLGTGYGVDTEQVPMVEEFKKRIT